ncbi:MAG: GWxTD domain-containing protein [Bacteroidia bacterium]|nr:GWxTD domain-containing protein [Bacteroidia bacterium]MDW8089068.1 GWxTD domain-containing protein [Bacteroidia bacterium]
MLAALFWLQVLFYVEPVRFFTLEGEPYVELFLGVDATSVRYVPEGDGYKAQVDFLLLLKNQLDEAVYADKFRFILPVVRDTMAPERQRLYVDVRRLRLPQGVYTLEVEGMDPHQLPRPQKVKAVTQFEVPAKSAGFGYSDLLYARGGQASTPKGYERHGLNLDLWITNGFFTDPDTLRLYGEIYHVDSLIGGEPYYLRLRLVDAQTGADVPGFTFQRRPRRPGPFEAFTFTLPVAQLSSGIYLTQIELCRNTGEVLASWYRRFHLFTTREPLPQASEAEYDSQYGFPEKLLDEYLEGLYYLATPTERSFQKTLKSFAEKKVYFVAFWKKRAERPGSLSFQEFRQRFEYARQHFKSSIRPGWRTDRGRVFIQYGPPNDMQFYFNEPDKYPYQIWVYNQIGAQSSVIFVFYDPDLITGEYPLLHSNKIGELQNRNWRAFLLRARAAATGETEAFHRFGSGGAFIFRDDQTIGFTRDDR